MSVRRQFLQNALTIMAGAAIIPPFFSKMEEIPDGWEIYELAGQRIFPVYGISGGLTSRWIFYLFRPWGNGKMLDVMAVEGTDRELRALKTEQDFIGFSSTKIARALKAGKYRSIVEGGDMGRGDASVSG